jgi:type IV pilus assembly protein PilA
MFCNHCGASNMEGAKFCANCGQPMMAASKGIATAVHEASELPRPAAATSIAGFGPYEPPPPPPVQQTSGKALASLISGIIGLVTLILFIPGLLAIIFGHIARGEIRRSRGQLKGEGMALSGLIMGYVTVAGLPFILIVAAIAIPNLLLARQAANEASAVATLRTINSVVVNYQSLNNKYPESLAEMQKAGLLDDQIASGQKAGYRFDYHLTTLADGTQGYEATAEPVVPNSTGRRFFYTNQDAVIRFETAHAATQDSPSL